MPYFGNMYSGIVYNIYEVDAGDTSESLADQQATINNIINNIVSNQQTDSVVNLVYVPLYYFQMADPQDQTTAWKTLVSPTIKTHDVNIVIPNRVGGYAPRNKKLLTFPYVYLAVDTLDDMRIYKYEMFRNPSSTTIDGVTRQYVTFRNKGFISAVPIVTTYPIGYDAPTGTVNPSQTMYLSKFPQVAMPVDSFKAFVANGGFAKALISGGASAANLGAGLGMGYLDTGSIFGVANAITDIVVAMNKGDTARGSQGISPFVSDRTYNFYYKKKSIKLEYAQKIDDYFDRYGYATNALKVPYRHSRTVYTYTKTKDCVIAGGCPSDDARKIADIFNKGITFWANPYAVGVYKSAQGTPIDNTPLGANAT